MGGGRIGFHGALAAVTLGFAVTGCQGKADEAAPTPAPSNAAQPAAGAATPQDWSKFAGPGWMVERAVEGKLTDGGEGDVVLVLRGTDPAKKVKNDGLGVEMLDLNPRRLVFLERRGAVYRRAGEAAGFLPSANSDEAPCLADPLEEGKVAISGKILEISLHYWVSCGSYGVSNETYKFRKEGERFRLIGYDRLEFSRSTHDADTTSINFLTGRREITSGNFDDEESKAPPPKKVTSIGTGKYWLDSLPPSGCQGAGEGLDWCFQFD